MRAADLPSLDAVFACMAGLGAVRVVAKPLSENDNTKQQIYLGGNFESLNVIPFGEVASDSTPKTPNMKAALSLCWISDAGIAVPAPHSKLILYPQYPEVRLSGFLRGCEAAPNEYLRPIAKNERRFDNAADGRVLLFGVTQTGTLLGYLATSDSRVAAEFRRRQEAGKFEHVGVLWQCRLGDRSAADSKAALLARLTEISHDGWHWSRRIRDGDPVPYLAPNGGGYTLEALFGIAPNGSSLPDFEGWEIKACGSDRVTLMTPEPNGGYYGVNGAEAFLRKYGRFVPPDSLYFTGIHKVGETCAKSGQVLKLRGYAAGDTTFDALGQVELVDPLDEVSAAWTFAKLLEHWGRKHALAVYVRCESRPGPPREYFYGGEAIIGEGTTFLRFLSAMGTKTVYYDPAPKLENQSTALKRIHARSQFRIRVSQLASLYESVTTTSL